MRSCATALALGVGLSLLSASYAQSGWLGGRLATDDAQAKLVLQIKDEKKQKAKNKACPPGKVFFEGKGCIDRERAERKEEKEKTKQTPPPAQPVKTDCRVLGPNEGAAGGAADPKMKYECEPLGNGNKRCCWVKYP